MADSDDEINRRAAEEARQIRQQTEAEAARRMMQRRFTREWRKAGEGKKK